MIIYFRPLCVKSTILSFCMLLLVYNLRWYSVAQRQTVLTTTKNLRIYAGVAQWLEFLPSKQAVEGSNPFARSTNI